MTTWLTTTEAASLTGLAERTIRWQARNGRLTTRMQKGQGGIDGQTYLVALESLSGAAQRLYLDRVLTEHEAVPVQVEADDPDAQDAQAPVEATEEVSPALEQPQQIRTIAELVGKYGRERAGEILESAAAGWKEIVEAALDIRHEHGRRNKKGRIEELATGAGISPATLYRKMDRYERLGALGLVNERYLESGKGLDGTRRRVLSDEAMKWIKAMCLRQPAPTGAHVYRQFEIVAPLKKWHVPSKATLYRVIDEILVSERVMGQQGARAFEQKCQPKLKRDYSSLLFMQVIVGDGHQFDVFVNLNGRPARLWLSCWEDMRSREIVGWCVTEQANSDTIALALRDAIMTSAGLPETLYIDNGKDYQSLYLMDFCRRMGIETCDCLPYHPQSKMIERLFGTVCTQFSMNLLGYCGNSPESRPVGFDAKKLLKQGKLLTVEQFVRLWTEYVDEYNNRVHSSLGDTPANVAANVPHARPGTIARQDLDVFLMRREGVLVHDGYVRLMGRDYWSHDIDLGCLCGERIQVWYDPNRMGEVLVWRHGKCIGTAVNRTLMEQGASRSDLTAEIRAARKVNRAVNTRIASYAEGLEDVLPEDVVKKARRMKRNYTSEDAGSLPAVPDAAATAGKVRRITGQEQEARQAQAVLQQARASAVNPDDLPVTRQRSRAERMLLAAGDEVLAGS